MDSGVTMSQRATRLESLMARRACVAMKPIYSPGHGPGLDAIRAEPAKNEEPEPSLSRPPPDLFSDLDQHVTTPRPTFGQHF